MYVTYTHFWAPLCCLQVCGWVWSEIWSFSFILNFHLQGFVLCIFSVFGTAFALKTRAAENLHHICWHSEIIATTVVLSFSCPFHLSLLPYKKMSHATSRHREAHVDSFCPLPLSSLMKTLVICLLKYEGRGRKIYTFKTLWRKCTWFHLSPVVYSVRFLWG